MTRVMVAAMGAALAVAGVAWVQVFSSTPDSSARTAELQRQPSLPAARSVTIRPQAPAAAPPPTAVTKISTSSSPELARPPVPYVHATRAPVLVKEDRAKEDKVADKSADAATASTAPVPAADDQEGARLAKSAIERDGYRGVKVVSKKPDGSWRGRAMRGQTEVGVTVDAEGNVRVD